MQLKMLMCARLFSASMLGRYGIWLSALLLCVGADGVLAQGISVKVVDVGGALNLLQRAIESYHDKNPGVNFVFTKAQAPDLPSALKTSQASGKPDIDLVLGGTDILAAGIDLGLWIRLLPDHSPRFPNLLDRYFTESRKMQELAGNQGLAVVYMLGGAGSPMPGRPIPGLVGHF